MGLSSLPKKMATRDKTDWQQERKDGKKNDRWFHLVDSVVPEKLGRTRLPMLNPRKFYPTVSLAGSDGAGCDKNEVAFLHAVRIPVSRRAWARVPLAE
jgi:hypothetical protein